MNIVVHTYSFKTRGDEFRSRAKIVPGFQGPQTGQPGPKTTLTEATFPTETKKKKGGSKPGSTRHLRSIRWKLKAAKEYRNLKKGAKSAWLKRKRIDWASVNRWVKKIDEWEELSASSLNFTTSNKPWVEGYYKEHEQRLYQMYRQRRDNGNKVTHLWLQTQMRHLLLADPPEDWDPAANTLTDKWCAGFCLRKKITLQRKTNHKSLSIYQRIHLVGNYQYWTIYLMADPAQNYPEAQRLKAHKQKLPELILPEFEERDFDPSELSEA